MSDVRKERWKMGRTELTHVLTTNGQVLEACERLESAGEQARGYVGNNDGLCRPPHPLALCTEGVADRRCRLRLHSSLMTLVCFVRGRLFK